MASYRRTIAAQDVDLGRVAGDWLDPFASDDEAAAVHAETDREEGIPFSDWCIIPVALAFVIGYTALPFLHSPWLAKLPWLP